MTGPIIGVDVGGTFTKLVVLGPDGALLERSRIPTDDSAARRLPVEVAGEVSRLEAIHGAARVGVACPGLVRDDEIVWMKGRLAVLEGLDWTRALGRSERVRVINDAHAALAGEVALGAGRGCRDVVLLTLGTGVGGAVMCDGRVLRGHLGRAGHLGHMSVNAPGEKDIVNTPGSLEDAIGNCTVARRSRGRFASTEALVAAVRAGDVDAAATWQASVQLLAAGIASIVNAVDPARVILGGGIAMQAGEALLSPLRHWLDEYEWRPLGVGVEIVLAELGEDAGAIGAAAHARDHRT